MQGMRKWRQTQCKRNSSDVWYIWICFGFCPPHRSPMHKWALCLWSEYTIPVTSQNCVSALSCQGSEGFLCHPTCQLMLARQGWGGWKLPRIISLVSAVCPTAETLHVSFMPTCGATPAPLIQCKSSSSSRPRCTNICCSCFFLDPAFLVP